MHYQRGSLHENRTCKRFVEIKSGNCRRALEDLDSQLRKITRYLKYKNMEGEVIGVYPMENALELLVL